MRLPGFHRRHFTRAIALLAITCTYAPPAFAHAEARGDHPATYAAAVHMIRDEIAAIERARGSGNFADVSARAGRLIMLADSVTVFADTLTGARQDGSRSVLGAMCMGLRAAAIELHDAADRSDDAAVANAAARFARPYAMLDAHVIKQYVCVMHCEPGKVYNAPGDCPVCGMMLQLITSDRYGVALDVHSKKLRAGSPTLIDFQVKDPAGYNAMNLQVVHEKLMHLMIVSEDLSWFDHVHPVPDTSGHFSLRYAFPRGGKYVLFHDFTPANMGMQVVPVELEVEGPAQPARTLVIDDKAPKRVDGYGVTLSHTALGIDVDAAMSFTLTRGGKPVTELEPFLGAMGHLVMISEDRASYVHSHPLAQSASKGPTVQFNMMFTRTGIYKAWGQFKRRGRVITVPFVVEVTLDGHTHAPVPDAAGAK